MNLRDAIVRNWSGSTRNRSLPTDRTKYGSGYRLAAFLLEKLIPLPSLACFPPISDRRRKALSR